MNKVKRSATLAITAKAKKLRAEGKDVTNFASGEPDFDTPDLIKQAAKQAIDSGFTKYTPSAGIPELKEAISQKFKNDNSLNYEPGQIVVSCGAKHSIYNTLTVLVNKGDEVIIPSPHWVSYPEMVHLCQGSPRFIKTRSQDGFKISPEELKRNITSKTKLLILNSPSNPTGCLYSKNELEKIAEICVARKVFVLSDEIYEKIIYDGLSCTSIASLGKDINDFTVTVNGLSKSSSMTGWRIGYLGGPYDIVTAVTKLQDHSTSCPSSISQKAAVAALSAPGDVLEKMRAEFQKRRDCMSAGLERIDKLGYFLPQGAFYMFCDISKTQLDSLTFADRLLEEASVSVIPGVSFGRDDYVRMSFATGTPEIEKGIRRIKDWITPLHASDHR
ncbi:pyridoxal phosphate-dependent aminotransferase [Candidatus Omnitrophota bacterium]